MNSTDTTTVGTTVTSPATGMRPALWTSAGTASYGACSTTGLPFAGTAVRLRDPKPTGARWATTGVLSGPNALPTVQIDALRRPTAPGGSAERTNSTPGDLSPEGPLS